MNKFILFFLLFFNCAFCFAEIVKDEIAEALPKGVKQPLINTSYNYESIEKIPINLKILKKYRQMKNDIFQFVKIKIFWI